MTIETRNNNSRVGSGDLFNQSTTRDMRVFFDKHVEAPTDATLGPVVETTNIKSSIGPFKILPEYKTRYPEVITHALASLYVEYNEAFRPLVAANKEWGTDYQHCITPDGTPVNNLVQIDMVGLPAGFLEVADSLRTEEMRDALRGRIFEIENSLAMYQFLENIFAYDGQQSSFKGQFRASLDTLREKHGMPIALLAITEQKHQAMRETEFGKRDGEPLTNEEVQSLSGFDRFFSPDEFQQHLIENEGQSDYLLYVRSSDPVAKLRKPNTPVENPLLKNAEIRRVIKANAITLNIDAPEMDPAARINDTKEYMQDMNMAYTVHAEADLLSPEFVEHLSQGRAYVNYPDGGRLSPEFADYLRGQGADPVKVESGETDLRAKPMKGSYGCYGHISGPVRNKKFRQNLRRNLRERGDYVIQPEMSTPVIINATDGQGYTYIDRVFLSTDGTSFRFMGGFRSLMPIASVEAQNGRVHGSDATVWAEIA